MKTWLKHDNGNNSEDIWWNLAKSYIFTDDRLLFLQ